MIIANSFSKSLAMTGWRIGYVVADEDFAKKLTKLNQISITCVPKFIQQAALEGLKKRKEITRGFRAECRKRADAAMEILGENGIPCSKPGAGFYVFPKLPVEDSYDVCMSLLDKHAIATVPGSVFGDYSSHVRISLCYPPDVIADSMNKLLDVCGCKSE
jgi:aspartate/methionine/tyrosine aminotransferase